MRKRQKEKPHFVEKIIEQHPPSVDCSGFEGLTINLRGLFMKRDYFDSIIGKVAEMTELPVGKVQKSNQEECVDARYVLIAVLSERYSDRQIAELGGWSIQLVNKAKNAFKDRCRFRWGLKELYLKLKE